MLNTLRKMTSGWIVQIMMLLLVVSFGVWGVADVFRGYGANDIAKVGSISLTGAEFSRRFDLAVRQLNQQFGKQFTTDEAVQLGVPSRVLSQMLAEATLDDTAHEMGLSLSPDTVGRLIREDPNLHGPSGEFDRTYFTQIAQAQGLNEDALVLLLRADYIRNQLDQGLVGEVTAPESIIKAIGEYRDDSRNVSYVVLTAPAASDIADPSDTDLTAYFDAHKSDYKAPEYRAISYFVLSPAVIAKSGDVTDEEAQKRYDEQKGRFVTPGTRHVEQIVFKDKADAEAAAKELAAGKTFDTLVAERNLKTSDIGVSGIVDGPFGPVIVRVTNIVPDAVKTFDEMKDQLKQEIAAEKAAADIVAMHDAIEDARAGGANLEEVAQKYGLKLVNVPEVDQSGNGPDGKPIPDLPAQLMAPAFESDVGVENSPIEPTNNTFVWFDVTQVMPAHDRALAEVRDKVLAAWKDAEREKKVAEQADALKAKLAGSDDLAKVAADAGLEAKKAEALTRGSDATDDLSAAAIAAAFDGPKGYRAVADGVDAMHKVLIVVNDTTVPTFNKDDPQIAQIEAQLDNEFVNDLLAAYVTERQSKIDIQINQAALAAALGLNQTQ
jgi:peptidyl-prolyl cis-trans isomerase D